MQIIKQPNGKFAIFSNDNLIIVDMTPDEVEAEFVRRATEDAQREVNRVLSSLNAGGFPYHQFTMSFADAVATHKKNKANCKDKEFNDYIIQLSKQT